MNDISANTPEVRDRLIKEMSTDERPREKAMRHGIKSLTDTELMAIIFSTGLKGKSVIELSRDILTDNGNHLSKVARLSVSEMLKRYKGIGPAKAITLLAALELGSRSAADAAKIDDRPIVSSEMAYKLMKHHFERLDHEEFWVLLLSQSGKVIREIKIGQGGVTGTTVDVKLIMRAAIEHLASAMIVFHNHPSGTLRPSPQDDALTKKIAEAAKLIDTRLNDHIIVTDASYFSYNDQGRL
ncbi:MAG: DNA repair protein RadC [Muribaculaceae bacterium]|nr:DNA repair protein RadC [Muribaculaceae bacterium]